MKFYRKVLQKLILQHNKKLDGHIMGAEIGVASGKTSAFLLQRISNLRLFLVDTWSPPDPGTPYHKTQDTFASSDQAAHEKRFRDMTSRLLSYQENVRILRTDSVAAARTIGFHTLDFVFIDGDHSYEGCLRDLIAWYHKVVPGGLFCGHDYVEVPSTSAFGVKRAVDDFMLANKLPPARMADGNIWWASK